MSVTTTPVINAQLDRIGEATELLALAHAGPSDFSFSFPRASPYSASTTRLTSLPWEKLSDPLL